LLTSPGRYHLKLSKQRRKEIKTMLFPGQLPVLDVLLVASDLYQVKIFVHFAKSNCVEYCFKGSSPVSREVHLQLLNGIHFNPLRERPGIPNEALAQANIKNVCHLITRSDAHIVDSQPVSNPEHQTASNFIHIRQKCACTTAGQEDF